MTQVVRWPDVVSLVFFILAIILLVPYCQQYIPYWHGCPEGVIILILYPLLAACIEPLFMNTWEHFKYPKQHPLRKLGGVPSCVILGWGWVMFYAGLLIPRGLCSYCGCSTLGFLGIAMLLSLGFGFIIELVGTIKQIWVYQKRRDHPKCLQKSCTNIPVLHIAGYPLLGFLTSVVSVLYNMPSVFSIDRTGLMFYWLIGLVVWFFGLYQFFEHEINNAVKRLKELKEKEEKEIKTDDRELTRKAREAQDNVIDIARKPWRVIIIHFPGLIVGIVMPFLLLMMYADELMMNVYNLQGLERGGLINLFVISLLALLVIMIIGAIVLAYAFHKRPENKYLDVLRLRH